MADGILGLGSSGSLDLNQDLIDKLKSAESTAVLDPITTNIEAAEAEIEAVDEIDVIILELLDLVDDFDLYTSDANIFDDVVATTSGSSVSFDAADTSNLEVGTISVTIEQLSQKDVYQSTEISDITEEMSTGTITISIGGDSYDFSTEGKTYEDLVEEMSTYSALDIALEQVSDDSYRLVIKSTNSGEDNAITISQTDVDLGFEDEDNHVLIAQNMLATVDGIDYNLSSNKIVMDNGLTISAVETGDSSISLERDDSSVTDTIEEIAEKYNELIDLVNSYIVGDEDDAAVISDSSTIKMMMSAIKDIFFETYGLEDEENIFVYGISFDSDGYMQVDSTELAEALINNYDDLKELFVGYAEKEGIGTKLAEYLDSLDGYEGLLTTYEDKLSDRVDTLNEDYDTASAKLDEKYELMATQFAAYTVIITQMENSFAALEAIIDSDD